MIRIILCDLNEQLFSIWDKKPAPHTQRSMSLRSRKRMGIQWSALLGRWTGTPSLDLRTEPMSSILLMEDLLLETIIPHVVSWFTRKALQEEEIDVDEDDEEDNGLFHIFYISNDIFRTRVLFSILRGFMMY